MNNRFKLLLLAGIALFAVPVHAQCSAGGLSLQATADYIYKASPDVGFLNWDLDYGSYWSGRKEIIKSDVHLMNIDCSTIAAQTSRDGHLRVFLFCKNKLNCVTISNWHTNRNLSENWAQVDQTDHESFGTQGEDIEQTENLARALQHFVFLLQAQYRQQHNSGSDPFGPPK